uniref:Uncharacterized protein n=1 Tax=Knipowitschia caucasica TaxID=637954 RepID=A0AAV2L3I5_KNICA
MGYKPGETSTACRACRAGPRCLASRYANYTGLTQTPGCDSYEAQTNKGKQDSFFLHSLGLFFSRRWGLSFRDAP